MRDPVSKTKVDGPWKNDSLDSPLGHIRSSKFSAPITDYLGSWGRVRLICGSLGPWGILVHAHLSLRVRSSYLGCIITRHSGFPTFALPRRKGVSEREEHWQEKFYTTPRYNPTSRKIGGTGEGHHDPRGLAPFLHSAYYTVLHRQ